MFLNVTKRRMTDGITITPSGGEGVASLAFLSHMSSPTSCLSGQNQAKCKSICAI